MSTIAEDFGLPISDMTDDEIASASRAGEQAFAASFNDDGNTPPEPPARAQGEGKEPPAPTPAPAPAAGTPAAPAPTPAPAASSSPAADPFAGVPLHVRNLLAQVPDLADQLRTASGRIAAQERELQQLRGGRAPSPAPGPGAHAPSPTPASQEQPLEIVETVRKELPEVAQAIEESVSRALGRIQQAAPAASPTPAAPAPSGQGADGKTPEESSLDRLAPNWDETLRSADYRLWLSMQPPEVQSTVRSTESAIVIYDSIKAFGAHRDTAEAASREAASKLDRKHRRAAGAEAPRGVQGERTPAGQTEHDAFLAGFNEG